MIPSKAATQQFPQFLERPVLPRQDGAQRLLEDLGNLLEAQAGTVAEVNDVLIGLGQLGEGEPQGSELRPSGVR
jgi:hypothetical protein